MWWQLARNGVIRRWALRLAPVVLLRQRPRRALLAIAGLSLLGGLALTAIVAVVFRNPLASFVGAHVMGAAGFHCDHFEVTVPLSVPPWPVRVAPMGCEAASGPVHAVRFEAPLEVRFTNGQLHASSESIDVDLRPQNRRAILNTLGDLTRVAGLDRPSVDLVLDWAALSAQPIPPFDAARAMIRRSGRPIVEMRELRLRPMGRGQSVSAASTRVEMAAGLPTETLSGHSTPTSTEIRLDFPAHLHVEVHGTELQAERPHVEFSVHVGANDDRARPASSARR